LTVSYKASDLNGATPVISVSGWNAALQDVAAPAPASAALHLEALHIGVSIGRILAG
jgi:hypothetical protein